MGERNSSPAEYEQLERRFDAAMLEIYERAGHEVGYWATRYLQMLRARGGLGTARRLLNAKATSDGYAALRDAGRLDLTVETYALRAEFQPLFTEAELAMASSRLAYFNRPLDISESTSPIAPDLRRLLDEALVAPPDRRFEYRDRVAAFGPVAVTAMDTWLAEGGSPSFACGVLEAIGRHGDPTGAARALRRLSTRCPDWTSVIEPAITRVNGAQRAARSRGV